MAAGLSRPPARVEELTTFCDEAEDGTGIYHIVLGLHQTHLDPSHKVLGSTYAIIQEQRAAIITPSPLI